MDATAKFEMVRQCAACCRATAAYAIERGMDGRLIGKLQLAADACAMAQRTMDLGYTALCEEMCEAAAAICAEVAAECSVIADDPSMAACAASCTACAAALMYGVALVDEAEMVMGSDAPRLLLLIADQKDSQGLWRVPVALVTKGFKGKQQYRVTASDLASIVANFRKRGTGDVVIDYDHSTLSAGDGEPKPAAGWLKEIDDAPDPNGVLWGRAELTPRASGMVAAREYKYVSPVIMWGARNKETGEQQGATLASVALTNSPLFEKLPALPTLACSDAGWEFDRGDVVDATKEKKQVAIKRVILAALAAGTVRLVADDNTEAGTFAVEGLRILSMSDVKRGGDGRYDFGALPHDEGVLVGSDVLRGMAVQEALDGAVKAGKITPAQRGSYEVMATHDLGAFKTLVASMKTVVDTTESGIAGGGDGDTLAAVDGRIEALVKEKQAASGGRLSVIAASAQVFDEHPELKTRRQKLMRVE